MSSPQNPNDPKSLSLKPGGVFGRNKKPDFSKVQGGSDSVPARGGSAEARGPDFRNVQGGSDTVPGHGGVGAQSYTVQKGDTLSHISKHFYGKASRWQAIFDANRDQLDDPDRIQPGQVLKIPAAD
jgi:nucleoid-associated protein YgaU